MARDVGAHRFLADGSFVTAKAEPKDVDAVLLLPPDFGDQVVRGVPAALEIDAILLARRPEELFAAEDAADWDEWVAFFSQTREADDRRKGLVEVVL